MDDLSWREEDAGYMRHRADRVIGFSPSAGFVISVIVTQTSHAGVTAWKSNGADLRRYERQDIP